MKMNLTMIKKNITKDIYIEKYLEALAKASDKEERIVILNKIYEDGFNDGFNEVTE